MTDPVDKLVDALARGGELVDGGRFTLDPTVARNKLRDFQLKDPHRYVLLLVQAAVLKGAQSIDAGLESGRLVLSFDGRPFSRADLEALYSDPFAAADTSDNQARQALGLGLISAQALTPLPIRVTTGDGSGDFQWVLERVLDQPDRITQAPVSQDPGPRRTTTIEVSYTGVLVRSRRALANFVRISPEELLLRQRCRFAPVPVRVNGEDVAKGMRLPSASCEVALEGHSGRVGLVKAGSAATGLLMLVQHGVWITTHALPRPEDPLWANALRGARVVALVNADGLHRDVSQLNVIQDALYGELLGAVDSAVEQASARARGNGPVLVKPGKQDYPDATGELTPKWGWGILLPLLSLLGCVFPALAVMMALFSSPIDLLVPGSGAYLVGLGAIGIGAVCHVPVLGMLLWIRRGRGLGGDPEKAGFSISAVVFSQLCMLAAGVVLLVRRFVGM